VARTCLPGVRVFQIPYDSGRLPVSELLETIRFVGHNRAIVGAAITAYDPSVDQDSKPALAAVAVVKELLAATCIDLS
jgi:arginase family enzyme